MHETDDRPRARPNDFVHPMDDCVCCFRWQIPATSAKLVVMSKRTMGARERGWNDTDHELRLVSSVQSTPKRSERSPDFSSLASGRVTHSVAGRCFSNAHLFSGTIVDPEYCEPAAVRGVEVLNEPCREKPTGLSNQSPSLAWSHPLSSTNPRW